MNNICYQDRKGNVIGEVLDVSFWPEVGLDVQFVIRRGTQSYHMTSVIIEVRQSGNEYVAVCR